MSHTVFLPLLIFTISMACIQSMACGQTFQYSRGWTNGKRSLSIAKALTQQQQPQEHQRYLSRDENIILADPYELGLMERYLLDMPHLMRNAFLNCAANGLYGNKNIESTTSVNNKKNNLFGNHHQSNEFFDELSGGVVEANDYGKH